MRLQAILFDYGGTLDGPASHWLDRMLELYREHGVEQPFERVKAAFYAADDAAYADPRVADMSLEEMMEYHVGVQLAGLGLDDRALQRRLAAGFADRSAVALAASRAVLERLAPHYRLGVVSNFYGNVRRILDDAGFAPLLSVVADSNRVGCTKPDRRIFEHALAALGAPPEAALHVGDSYERDVCAAKAVGLRTAWLVGERRDGVYPQADLIITSLDDLLDATAAPLLAGGRS